jgi:chorismate mutase
MIEDDRLLRLRRRIDALDEQIVRLLNERASCALEIGHVKESLGLAIYQPERERDVLDHVTGLNTGPLDQAAIRRLFERIIDEARRLERVGTDGSDTGKGEGRTVDVEGRRPNGEGRGARTEGGAGNGPVEST